MGGRVRAATVRPAGGPRILLSGGGTAGHIAPALAVAEELRAVRPDVELLYIGTPGGLEADLVPRAGVPFRGVPVTALSGRRRGRAIRAMVLAGGAVVRARRLIGGFRPHAALGTGGYVAGPVVLAAYSRGVPAAIHEQNLRPGITNRWLTRFVRQIYVSFAASREHFAAPGKVVFTGYPVRRDILAADRRSAAAALGLDPDRPTLLIAGGSRGARTINEAVKSGLAALLRRLPHLQVVVSTGEAYFADVQAALAGQGLVGVAQANGAAGGGQIRLFDYIHAMHHAYAAADLVFCRAGGSVHELAARGLPSVLVPSPNVAYDQQTDNARALAAAGAALVLSDEALDGQTLAQVVGPLLTEPGRLRQMAGRAAAMGRPAAGRDLAARLLKLGGFPLDPPADG